MPQPPWRRLRWLLGVGVVAVVLMAGLAVAASQAAPSGRGVGQAGCAWHAQHAGPGTTADLYGVSFPDTQHGWAVGGIDKPVIRATTDGGLTWRSQDLSGTNGLASVSFVDDVHGWAAGVHNTLVATTDGGSSWTSEHPGIEHDGNIYGVWFVDRFHGWIVGQQGLLRVTADGGRSWSPQTAGTEQDLDQVRFSDPQHGWIVAGAGELFRTADGGTTWAPAYAANAKRSEAVAGASFLDSRHGWESGSEDSTDGEHHYGVVSQTDDGGATWKHRISTRFDDERFTAITFVDARQGWVAGYSGELYYTDNGGRSWASRPSPNDGEKVNEMVFRDATHGWAVGNAATIMACTPEP
ncbi:MAG TPA: YCF48-related protein [Frankiaceae bacterium]|nr:YCF48-related protein [Frankiaceae bacterium]